MKFAFCRYFQFKIGTRIDTSSTALIAGRFPFCQNVLIMEWERLSLLPKCTHFINGDRTTHQILGLLLFQWLLKIIFLCSIPWIGGYLFKITTTKRTSIVLHLIAKAWQDCDLIYERVLESTKDKKLMFLFYMAVISVQFVTTEEFATKLTK